MRGHGRARISEEVGLTHTRMHVQGGSVVVRQCDEDR